MKFNAKPPEVVGCDIEDEDHKEFLPDAKS
jgi:hypothetical protein